ncbi:unnamed protein product [Dibothriocephalus latus]|uniref:Uncharacterized protein n=1 Tax=Dibothriocephalus latus TaxID=60516 RepID=A0A3P7LTS6_DIBLA|nr:unnamed protein product [Dibothriocephalus latus]
MLNQWPSVQYTGDIDQHGQPVSDSQVLLFAEQLEKHVNPHVSSQLNMNKAKQVILDNNPNAEAFLAKYKELQLRNIRELDPFVYLLAKIKHDPDLLNAINTNRTSKNGNQSQTDDVDQLQRLIHSQDNSYNTSAEPQQEQYTSDDENTYYPAYGMGDGDLNDQESCLERLQALANVGFDTSKKRSKQPLRTLPQWIYERPYLSMDYFLSDILTAKGNDGAYIKALPLKDARSARNFAIDENMREFQFGSYICTSHFCFL